MATLQRPVVRSFKTRFTREAAEHVRAGGHAVIWASEKRGQLVYPPPAKGDIGDLARWSLLDLGRERLHIEKAGLLKGLATAPVPRDCVEIVKRRVERDSVHPGPVRELELDCLACGACCHDNDVELEDEDQARFARGGRPELGKAPYARRRDGKLVLTLAPGKVCRHLASDNKCGIYALRPNACSQFPAGSECCLFAREEELQIFDGVKTW